MKPLSLALLFVTISLRSSSRKSNPPKRFTPPFFRRRNAGKTKRTSFKKGVRQDCMDSQTRDGKVLCSLCGQSLSPGETPDIDHATPWSEWFKFLGNVYFYSDVPCFAAHARCNRRRKAGTGTTLKNYLERYYRLSEISIPDGRIIKVLKETELDQPLAIGIRGSELLRKIEAH